MKKLTIEEALRTVRAWRADLERGTTPEYGRTLRRNFAAVGGPLALGRAEELYDMRLAESPALAAYAAAVAARLATKP